MYWNIKRVCWENTDFSMPGEDYDGLLYVVLLIILVFIFYLLAGIECESKSSPGSFMIKKIDEYF